MKGPEKKSAPFWAAQLHRHHHTTRFGGGGGVYFSFLFVQTDPPPHIFIATAYKSGTVGQFATQTAATRCRIDNEFFFFFRSGYF